MKAYQQISSRIKVLSKLDPSEKRKVQEGQFNIQHQKRAVNLRVEVVQTIHGELIVIRLHERRTAVMELTALGLTSQAYEQYQKILARKSGLMVVVGPTGSGKTTTLYSTISYLSKLHNYNVMTIEDPVEFQLEGINQMQVNLDTDFTFVTGLKTILRLTPDVVFVGEIRDRETSKIAVQSGLTGQVVLSTLHAADSVGALFRLLDLEVESYLLNSSLVGILAQRLVRMNCEACKAAYAPTPGELDVFNKVLGRAPKQLMRSTGCPECNNLAYKGRTGIFEVLVMDSSLRNLLREQVNEDYLRAKIVKSGFVTMLKDGLIKAERGITTVDEILRNSMRFT